MYAHFRKEDVLYEEVRTCAEFVEAASVTLAFVDGLMCYRSIHKLDDITTDKDVNAVENVSTCAQELFLADQFSYN